MYLQGFLVVASVKWATLQTFQILDRVMYRVEWIRHQEREKKKLEDEKEKERGWFLPCSWTLHVCFEYPSTQCKNETNVEMLTCTAVDWLNYIYFLLVLFRFSCNTVIVMTDFDITILLLGFFVAWAARVPGKNPFSTYNSDLQIHVVDYELNVNESEFLSLCYQI